jgi:hypothetical protein
MYMCIDVKLANCNKIVYGYTLTVDQKSDIYCFRVVLMELLTRQCPIEPVYDETHVIIGRIRERLRSNIGVEELLSTRASAVTWTLFGRRRYASRCCARPSPPRTGPRCRMWSPCSARPSCGRKAAVTRWPPLLWIRTCRCS